MIAHFICRLSLILCLALTVCPAQAVEKGPRGVVQVGVFPFEPLNFIGQNGVAQGLYPDLLREIVKDENWSVKFVPGSWAEGLERLQRGEIDLLLSVAYSPERAEIMDFTFESVAELWGQVFLKPNSKLKNINSLEGRRIAVMSKDISGINFIATTEKFAVHCEIVEFPTHAKVFAAVQEGKVDAGVAPQHFGLRHAREFNLIGSSIMFSPFSIYFASKKGTQHELLSHIDAHLSSWKKEPNSFYYERLDYWLGTRSLRTKIPTWLIYASIFGIVSILVFASFSIILKRTVNRRTKELQESEERMRLFFERQIVGMAITSQEKGWIQVNDRLLQMLGYSRDELAFRTWEELTHPEDLAADLAQFNQLLSGKINDYSMEKRFIRKNGTVVFTNLSVGCVRHADSSVNFILALLEDITERKLAEEEKITLEAQLRQAQKMEAIGQLAGGVAHDFNNMLSVILGHAEMAMEQVDRTLPLFADLEEISKAANRSADITRQLLAFARKQTVAPQLLDLNKTVEGMLKMLRRLIGEDIDLIWSPGAKLWPVKVDPSQIDQIMANLCLNARDAISGVGKLTIETGNNTFDQEYCDTHADFVTGDYVRISISDNGCGMSEETLAHIFEPFFTTKGVGKGTGLGLATVYGAVKQNKGFMNVYSETGLGTTFTIYLPKHATLVGGASSGIVMQPGVGCNETILLVEDEPTILKMTARMLQYLGYNVLSKSTPREALLLAGEFDGEIQLLVTDIVMPEMNGRDLAKNILSLHPHLKCLYMSGYTSDIIAQQGILEEGVHFIQKPFSKDALATKIRLVLKER